MTYGRRVILIILMLATLGTGIVIAPPRAQAQLPVIDAANLAVNTLSSGFLDTLSAAYQARKGPLGTGISLDTLAWTVGKIAIQMMTKSVVNWINSGFNGAPSFVTNLSGFMTQVADVAAGNFIKQLSSNSALKSPFQSQVAANTSHYYAQSSTASGFFASIKYTLNKITSNDSAFLAGNFSQGGWSAWYATTQQPQNNPFGAQMIADAQLRAQIAAKQGTQSAQLGWAQGFLSWCGNATGGGGGANQGGTCKTDDDCAGALACINGSCAVDTSLENPAQTCTNKDGSTGTIQTPGSVISAQLNKTLGLSGDSLVTADEFNEIIGALLSQLVSQVLGGMGLSGVASVSSGGSGYIDKAADPNQITQGQQQEQQGGALITSINSESAALNQYQTDWQSILNEAQATKAQLDQCDSSDTGDETTVANIIAQAQTALAKGSLAIAALQNISNEATQAIAGVGSGLPDSSKLKSITEVSTEFQAFIGSPTTPSATEITYVHDQAVDHSGDNGADTLFTQLVQIYTGISCPVGS